MSVINKMLRDLDQRRASTLDPALRTGTGTPQRPAAVVSAPPYSVAVWGRAGGLVLGVGLLVLAVWWALARFTGTPSTPDTVVAAPTVYKAIPPPAPAPTVPPLLATPVVQPVPPPSSKPARPESRDVMHFSTLLTAVARVEVPTPPAPAPSVTRPASDLPDPAVAAQRQQTALRDVLVQAQSLYSGGSADAAIQLLQDSLHTAERASPPAPASVQLPLLRELCRMELAQGRAAAVLELLGRLEALISGQPDLWAVRANAAQRLGRHAEAIQFYAQALQSRPAEQRWLLGSAVSQAALGQLGLAAELAEKARAIAPVSKEVWAYLRQQGVALSERP